MAAVDEVGERTLEAWYPDWPIVAAGVEASVPAIVVAANRVTAVSPAGRQEGVTVGLRRREAQARCPELMVIAADPARDTRTWEPVVAAVEAFSPGVEVGDPGTVRLATRGPSRYFGGDRAMAAKVAAAVDAAVAGTMALDITAVGATRRSAPTGCRVGVADGRFAAGLAARLGAERERQSVVAPGQSPAWLASRSVATLGQPDLVDLLVRLGVRTLGQLAELPSASVLARFGPEGAEAQRRARGLDDRPLSARSPPPDLAVTAELDPPVGRVDRAAFVARSLADRMHAGLAGLGLACTRVAIEAESEHGEHLVRLWRHDGALDAAAVAERVRWQLDAWLGEGRMTAALTLLRLVPDEVRPDHGRQLGLWGASAVADAQVDRTLARVQGMLGPDAVVTAVVGGGRDPADQARWIPWGAPRSPRLLGTPRGAGGPEPPGLAGARDVRRRRREPAPPQVPGSSPVARTGARALGRPTGEVPPWPGGLPGPSPATVHPTPVPAQLRDAAGHPVAVNGRGTLSAPPAALAVAGRRWTDLTAWAGPWPVEERWWDAEGRRRARFQMCVASGTAYLVVRQDGGWWVEATYD